MVEHQPSKLNTWVRFPSPALKMNILFIMREWLSWWSTTLPRSGSRVRVPSRALLNSKNTSASDVFFFTETRPRSRLRIFAPLRSVQYQRPPDVVHPVSLLLNCRTRTVIQLSGRLFALTLINWEFIFDLNEVNFVNFPQTTKRAGTQHIKSAGENLSPYL